MSSAKRVHGLRVRLAWFRNGTICEPEALGGRMDRSGLLGMAKLASEVSYPLK